MKKVCIFYPGKVGGVTSSNKSVIKGLELLGYEVVIFNSIISFLKSGLLKSVFIGDVVVISCLRYGVVNILSRKSIFVLHGCPRVDYGGICKYLSIWLTTLIFSRFSNRVIAVSQFVKVVNQYLLGLKVTDIIGNGLHGVPAIIERTNKLESDKVKLIYLGRLVKQKNIDVILESIDLLSMDYPIELHIIGGGENLKDYKNRFNSDSFIFYGEVKHNDIWGYLDKADIFVSLCETEAFGITFIEALSRGLKIIAPTTGGHIDIFRNSSFATYVDDVTSITSVQNSIIESISCDYPTKIDVDNILAAYSEKSIGERYSKIIESI